MHSSASSTPPPTVHDKFKLVRCSSFKPKESEGAIDSRSRSQCLYPQSEMPTLKHCFPIAALHLLLCLGMSFAQDTRIVNEPKLPPVCSTSKAQLRVENGHPAE